MERRIVDAWMQHPTRRLLEQPFLDSLRRWTRQALAADDLPIELSVAALDEAGVRLGLLSAWHGPQGALVSNDEVAGWVRAHPRRFAGLASVDLARPMDAVRELRRRVREGGFVGLRIVPWLWGLPPDDRRYYPLYAECVELGIPFCTQVGHTGPLLPSETGRPIPYLEHVALEFPELVIVGGHVGFPWTNEMISLCTKLPNVYVDTSAYTAKRYPPELVAYLRGHGRRKVLFGTNHPMLSAKRCLEGLESLGLDEETTRLFLYENAERVFQLPAIES